MGMGDRFTKTIEDRAAAKRAQELHESKKAHFEAVATSGKILGEHFAKAIQELTARLEEALKEGKRELRIAEDELAGTGSSLETLFKYEFGRDSLLAWLIEEGFQAKKGLKSLGGRWVEEINAEAGGYFHNQSAYEITINW